MGDVSVVVNAPFAGGQLVIVDLTPAQLKAGPGEILSTVFVIGEGDEARTYRLILERVEGMLEGGLPEWLRILIGQLGEHEERLATHESDINGLSSHVESLEERDVARVRETLEKSLDDVSMETDTPGRPMCGT